MNDCDDSDSSVHPNSDDPSADGLDQNCDGVDGVDRDGDGYAGNLAGEQGDCNDSDASVYPGAQEVALDGIDQDCDGFDLGDWDGDSWGSTVGDCDDRDASINPGATELVDCRDNNCDGRIDEGLPTADADADGCCEGTTDPELPPCCKSGLRSGDCDDNDPTANVLDSDGDGIDTCGPDGLARTGDEDCDDSDPNAYPGAIEIPGNAIDEDCDGETSP